MNDERGERRPGDVGGDRLLRSPEPLRNHAMVSDDQAEVRRCERRGEDDESSDRWRESP